MLNLCGQGLTRAILVSFITVVGLGCNGSDETQHDASGQDVGASDVQSQPDQGVDTDALTDTDTNDVGDGLGQPDAGGHWPAQDMGEEPALGWEWEMPVATGNAIFSVLVANVGNIDVLRCARVDFNLCWAEQERLLSLRIAQLDPDIIVLQEVLASEQCAQLTNIPPDHVCHEDFVKNHPEQARRLVGPDYTVACDARVGYECIAMKVGLGQIEGCPQGELCRAGARVGAPIEGCDAGFTISAVTAQIGPDARRLDIVNAHPPSGATDLAQARACRRDYLAHVFGEDQSLREADVALVAGDFNMDPYRDSQDGVDVSYWQHFVGTIFDDGSSEEEARRFAYHSGIVEHDPPYWTTDYEKTLDHAVSNGLIGRCVTLGAHEGFAPLDRNHGTQLSRLDHLALLCELGFAD